MQTFDVTVAFETDALAEKLRAALDTIPMKQLDCRWPVAVVVRYDSGVGELYCADEELPELSADDWCVTGRTVSELVDGLRKCMNG